MDSKMAELKAFVKLLEANPAMLHKPELGFFKAYLESLGCKIPPPPKNKPAQKESKSPEAEMKKECPKSSKKMEQEPLDFTDKASKKEPKKEMSDNESKSSEVSADELS